MRVLVLEGEPGAAREVERRLMASGHEVLRCHEPGLPAFPCVGLSDGVCPLDEPGVDVAVTVRGHVRPSPAPTEDGAVCALRHKVPLVAAGRTVLNPFARWLAADVAVDDIVAACEQAAGYTATAGTDSTSATTSPGGPATSTRRA